MDRNLPKYRLLALVIAASLLPTAAFGAKPPARDSRLSPPDSAELSLRQGNARISAETGAPLALYRMRYAVAADTPEAMARQYLTESFNVLRLANPSLDDLQHHATRSTAAGHTVRFRQHYRGIPVYGAEVTVTLSPWNEVTYVMNGYKGGIDLASTTPAIAAGDARGQIIGALGLKEPFTFDEVSLEVYDDAGTWRLVHRVEIIPRTAPHGDWVGLVDAHDGSTVRLWNTAHYAPVNGTGNVFDPDPLSSSGAAYGDPGYTDGGDATTPQLAAETFSRTLLDIDLTTGTHTLVGPWAEIVDTESPFNGLYGQASSTFTATRTDDLFEAVNTYFHIDAVMRYLNVTLGLSITPFQYAGGARFDPHGLSGADNSHYLGGTGVVAFGEGGVDDAEDADVVVHELGHGLHDWVTSGGLSQVNGLSEGIGDFVAQSYSRAFGQWAPADPEYNWVFHWDGHNPFWGGRITNYGATYPGGLVGQVHTDGQIWATCMMLVWDAIGRDQTERAHWTGIGMTNGASNQNDAAEAVMQAAISLGYPFAEQQAMSNVLTGCGYTVTAPARPSLFADGFESGNTTAWSTTVP